MVALFLLFWVIKHIVFYGYLPQRNCGSSKVYLSILRAEGPFPALASQHFENLLKITSTLELFWYQTFELLTMEMTKQS